MAVKHRDAVVVSGGAKGVDSAAERAAQRAALRIISYRPYSYTNIHGRQEFSIETVTFDGCFVVNEPNPRRINPPFFPSYGKAAFARNEWIVEDADVVVAFWDGQSRGTKNSLEIAERLGKSTWVFT